MIILSNIEIISKIKRDDLDEKNYFRIIVEAENENEMFTEDDLVNM